MTASKFIRQTVLLSVLISLLFLMLPSLPADASGYRQANLVSDIPRLAKTLDPSLVNPWGITFAPTGILWVSDNGTGVATLYRPNGNKLALTVTIPPPAGSAGPAAPTGLVLNETSDFIVSKGSLSAPSRFLFATEDGTISGWSPTVDGTNAILAVDNSASGAVYKGIAIGSNASGNFIYATDFHDAKVDVFDKNFQPASLTGNFTDPDLPAGFAPFGIRNIGGQIFVTYAKQLAPDNHDDEAGPGNGFVDIYNTDGVLIERFASHGTLNSPWGLALAPAKFGVFSGALLVGNFGDGRINAFDPDTGEFLGQLTDNRGRVIVNDGLWGLTFFQLTQKRGAGRGMPNELFFSAGLNDEADGLVGKLVATPPVVRGPVRRK